MGVVGGVGEGVSMSVRVRVSVSVSLCVTVWCLKQGVKYQGEDFKFHVSAYCSKLSLFSRSER